MSKSTNRWFSPTEKIAGVVGGLILVLTLGGLMLGAAREPSGSIHGRVASGDSGIEGASVELWSLPAPGSRGNLVATAETGPTGRFVFRDVRPGAYTVLTEQVGGASPVVSTSEARVASAGVTSIALAAR